jgi:hypothetical protein
MIGLLKVYVLCLYLLCRMTYMWPNYILIPISKSVGEVPDKYSLIMYRLSLLYFLELQPLFSSCNSVHTLFATATA